MSLFSFQGKVWAGERTAAGKLLKPQWAGNVPTMTLQLATESSNKTESFSGLRMQYGRLRRGKAATLNMVFDEWLPQNIALAIWASQLNVPGSTVTGEPFPDGVLEGDYVRLDHPFISALAITDSAGTPAPLPTANYRLESANAGLIEILDPGAFIQPFKAAYTYAERESFTMFTAAPPERYILLDGINTETDEPVIVTLYRCSFDPVTDLALINDEYGNFSLTGSVLYDVVNARDANFGGFGRIDQKAA
ncbi:phage tail tube protein [Pseudomonas paralcaligenes]|uniref:phage tail tube protein n=1 Tax=Pseudomonas paralcaligenes TaxID=2772558 RepID=UPI001C7FE427|nr:hypothetical protein [Pseudomonas paralcaligenes]